MTLEVRIINAPVSHRDHQMFADMIQEVWGPHIKQGNSYTKLTTGVMHERLSSGQFFFAAYAPPNQKQLKELEKKYGFYDLTGKLPCGIMETIALKSNGNYQKAALPFDELTNKGRWIKRPAIADLILFVDLTSSPIFKVKGTGRAIINEAKNYLKQHPMAAITYTPDDSTTRRFHELMGAEIEPPDILVKNARPWYKIKHVRSTRYHEF